MHPYRTKTCGELRKENVGQTVRLSGWVHRVRDHGGLLFIDLRDHYGITQCVVDPASPAFAEAETLKPEWVVRVDGEVVARSAETSQSKSADGRGGGQGQGDRGAVGGEGAAAAGVRRARTIRRRRGSNTASSTSAARACTPTS